MSTSDKKPEYPLVISLLGGVFILGDGALGLMIGVRYGRWPVWIWDFPNSELILGITGTILGMLVILLAVLAYKQIAVKMIMGIIIIVASVMSLFLTMGGYVVGFALGLIGGVMYIVWEPADMKNCVRCGREILLESWYCPYCSHTYWPGYQYYTGQQYQYQQGQQQAPVTGQQATSQVIQTPQATAGQRFCMKCGAAIAEGTTFCSNCGQRT